MATTCCDMMARQLDWACDEHDDPADCPDSLVARWPDGQFGLRVHDGGSSVIPISVCPWCATPLAPGAQPARPQGVGDQPWPVEGSSPENLTKRIVDDFGRLASVSGGTKDPTDPATSVRFEQYEFVFEHGCITVSVDPEDDTIRLEEVPMTLQHVVPLTETAPWSAAVGSGALWTWILENHNGYRNGFQIEFGHSRGYFGMQLMAEATELTAAAVSPQEGQFQKP